MEHDNELIWVGLPGADDETYGVYLFRAHLDLMSGQPALMLISADTRFDLFVNGEIVCTGPPRGDLERWWAEPCDLAEYAVDGQNSIAVRVFYPGPKYASWSHIMHAPALGVAALNSQTRILERPDVWQVALTDAYTPILDAEGAGRDHRPIGCRDRLYGDRYPWGWETFADEPGSKVHWVRAVRQRAAWTVAVSPIPPIKLAEMSRSSVTRSTTGVDGLRRLRVDPRQTVRILLDRGFLTNAYPEITVSGGAGSRITLVYAEALVDPVTGQKKKRDQTDGLVIQGIRDEFVPDGGKARTFRPLWFRTYRFLEVTVETTETPLVIDDWTELWAGQLVGGDGTFHSNDTRLNHVWRVGRWTLSCCVLDSFMDCPYYERMQYVGDTRIQALVLLYTEGSDAFIRKAIGDFGQSRKAAASLPGGDGLTTQRYPARLVRLIPTFSLLWIGMLHDLWWHRPAEEFVAGYLTAVDEILSWFGSRVREDGLLGSLPGMVFVDWTSAWPWNPDREARPGGGEPPGARDGGGATVSLLFAIALRWAADMHDALGTASTSLEYRSQADRVVRSVRESCWVADRSLFEDRAGSGSFSQHTNTLAVLADAVTGAQAQALMKTVLADSSLIRSSYYFRFYLFEALHYCGLGERILDQIDPWKTLIDEGFTTFPEILEPGTRSDCHAWSASPTYELTASVAGVRPAAPGFREISIVPRLGRLRRLSCHIPHHAGTIEVFFEVSKNGSTHGHITLPEGTPGTLAVDGSRISLPPGQSHVF